MDDLIATAWSQFRIATAIVGISGFATLGIALVCKALKWAPINITVTVNKFDSEES